jgi:hypothetical protein
MGIPARELNGYAIATEGNNKTPLSINLKGGDLLHAWPEFYDVEFGWVPVDPTWGNTSGIDYFTKLDTNHFVFVIKGLDSELPLPAGAYKLDGSEKQVEVAFAQDINSEDFDPEIALYKSFDLKNIFKLEGEVYYLKNTGKTVIYINNNPVLPEKSVKYSFENDQPTVNIKDATGKTHGLEAEYINSYIYKPSDFIWIAFLAVLALCTSLYGVIARSMAPKTPLVRLRRLLQGLSR